MDVKATYIVKEGNRSAFWTYEFLDGDGPDYKVKYTYGRLGLPPESLSPPTIKTHRGGSHRVSEVQKKISEKLRKGYQLQNQDVLNREQRVAEQLGHQYKIQRLEFISSRAGNEFVFGKEYDPDCGVVVEVLNSWQKESTYLYLTRTESHTMVGCVMGPTECRITGLTGVSQPNWVKAIRTLIKETAQVVAKIMIEKFAVIGTRLLSLCDDDSDVGVVSRREFTELACSKVSSVGEQALLKFASLGARSLDL